MIIFKIFSVLKTLFRASRYVWEEANLYEAGSTKPVTQGNIDMYWRVGIQVQPLNMHGGFHWAVSTRVYWCSSAIGGEVRAKSKAIWETGSRDNRRDPESSPSSHQATPLVSLLHGEGIKKQPPAGPRTSVHSPILPAFINVCHTAWHWWPLFHTLSAEGVCVSHLVQSSSFIDVTTKNTNDSCRALCPGYREQPLSSNSSKLPVCTYRGT